MHQTQTKFEPDKAGKVGQIRGGEAILTGMAKPVLSAYLKSGHSNTTIRLKDKEHPHLAVIVF